MANEGNASIREEIMAAFARLPHLREPGEDPEGSPPDVLGLVVELNKVLRKIGLQQARSSREVVGTVEDLAEKMIALQEMAAREQARAAEREGQLAGLAEVLVGILDLLGRLGDALRGGASPADLAEQVDLARRSIEQDAGRAGLVVTGLPGETFDPEAHALVGEAPAGGSCYRVVESVRRGYRLNGRTLRKARVRIERCEGEE